MKFYSQLGEDALLGQFFGFRTTGFYLDIGAFDGIYLSNTYLFDMLGWTGVLVEAHPDYFARCLANRPRSRCVHAVCLAESRGAVPFRAEPGGLLSGVAPDESAAASVYRRLDIPFDGFRTVEVPSTCVRDLLSAYGGGVDFASIDVEGAELEVLAGFDWHRQAPRVLLLEGNGDAAKAALDEYLRPIGYEWARSMAWNHFYVRSPEDLRRVRGLAGRCKLEKPPHPLGERHGRIGDAVGERLIRWEAFE